MQDLTIRHIGHEQHVIKSVLALFLAGPFAGLGRLCTERIFHHFGNRIGGGLAGLARAGQHHLVIDKILAIRMAEQEIGPVNIFGVDRRHDEGRGPFIEVAFEARHHARGLARSVKSRRKRERIAQDVEDRRLLGGSLHGSAQTSRCAAGKCTGHCAHPAANFGCRFAEAFLSRLLRHHDAQIEGDGIEPAGKTDTRAAGFRRLVMFGNLLCHPCRFAAQIGIIGAGFDTGGNQIVAI